MRLDMQISNLVMHEFYQNLFDGETECFVTNFKMDYLIFFDIDTAQLHTLITILLHNYTIECINPCAMCIQNV